MFGQLNCRGFCLVSVHAVKMHGRSAGDGKLTLGHEPQQQTCDDRQSQSGEVRQHQSSLHAAAAQGWSGNGIQLFMLLVSAAASCTQANNGNREALPKVVRAVLQNPLGRVARMESMSSWPSETTLSPRRSRT